MRHRNLTPEPVKAGSLIWKNMEKYLLHKHPNHSHFWIEDGYLNESYKTIRGLRYMTICKSTGFDDDANCTDEKARQIIHKNKYEA